MGESKRTSTSLTGGGGSWSGFGAGGVNFGSSDFQNTIIGEAVKAAVEKMSTEVIADRPKVAVRQVTVNGLVAAVTGGQIVLNVGSRAGVKVGDQLTVERVGSEIKDPATGKVIRRMTSPVGAIRVVDVDEQSAVANVVSGSGFKVGDIVKSFDVTRPRSARDELDADRGADLDRRARRGQTAGLPIDPEHRH